MIITAQSLSSTGRQIVALYKQLARIQPSPVVLLFKGDDFRKTDTVPAIP